MKYFLIITLFFSLLATANELDYTAFESGQETFNSLDDQKKCSHWPEISHGFNISSALDGALFHYNFRFNCKLSNRFEVIDLIGSYKTIDQKHSFETKLSKVYKVTYNSNDREVNLYRKLFAIPIHQTTGNYNITGCVQLYDNNTDSYNCINIIPRSIEVVKNRGH